MLVPDELSERGMVPYPALLLRHDAEGAPVGASSGSEAHAVVYAVEVIVWFDVLHFVREGLGEIVAGAANLYRALVHGLQAGEQGRVPGEHGRYDDLVRLGDVEAHRIADGTVIGGELHQGQVGNGGRAVLLELAIAINEKDAHQHSLHDAIRPEWLGVRRRAVGTERR